MSRDKRCQGFSAAYHTATGRSSVCPPGCKVISVLVLQLTHWASYNTFTVDRASSTVSHVKSFGLLSLPMLQDKIWARTPGYKATKVQTTTIIRSRCFCCYENNRNVYSGIVTLKNFEVKYTLYVHWVNYSPNGFMEYRTSDYTEHIQALVGSHTDCASMNHTQSTDLTLGCSWEKRLRRVSDVNKTHILLSYQWLLVCVVVWLQKSTNKGDIWISI